MQILVAAVEGGGSSFEVAICAAKSGKILHRTSVDSTGDPATTLTRCALFLQKYNVSALGIATFGPVGIRPSDPETYGRILPSSPKQAWRGVDVLTPLREACGGTSVPVLFDTDVNAPAAAEYAEENGAVSSCAYVTVGTGVGVGLVVNHSTVQGLMHPEGGHVAVPPLAGDSFGGYSWGKNSSCPYHGINTVESLASSVALMERYQQMLEKMGGTNVQALDRSRLKDVPDESEIWDHAANALASLCTTLLLTLSIERIVLGGGVMRRTQLLGKVQTRTAQLLNNYILLDATPRQKGGMTNEEALQKIIRVSRHGDDAGYVNEEPTGHVQDLSSLLHSLSTVFRLMGAIQLARRALTMETVDKETVVKREAFQTGLVHGILVGIIGTALFVKFGLQNRR